MFSFLKKEKKEAVNEQEKPVQALVAADVEVTSDELFLGEYEKLADKIGFRPGALVEEKLKHFLKTKEMKIFNSGEVQNFLTKQYGRGSWFADEGDGSWSWIPLTKTDKQKKLINGIRENRSGHIDNDRTYQLQIPMYVLRLVKEIRENFPEVSFYVSGVSVPVPDPFLLVTGVGMSDLIVAHWNEPDFGKE